MREYRKSGPDGNTKNQTSAHILREGVFYGQCSELCGVYHGFMPIVVEAVSTEKYFAWLDSQA